METEKISRSENDHLLLNLKYYLNYELSSVVLYLLIFMFEFTIFLSVLAAIIFTPFLIYILFKTKKSGWLTAFLILILLPPIVFVAVGIKHVYLVTLLLVQLGLFYFYCFILRFVVYDWAEGIKWKAVLREQQLKTKLEKLIFKRQLDKEKDI